MSIKILSVVRNLFLYLVSCLQTGFNNIFMIRKNSNWRPVGIGKCSLGIMFGRLGVICTNLINCKAEFHSSRVLHVNAHNGRGLDGSQEIADAFYQDEEGLNNYKEEKLTSIMETYEEDVRTAVEDGVDPEEIKSWEVTRNQLISELATRIGEAKILADIPSNPEDQDHVSVPSSPEDSDHSSSASSSVPGSPMDTAPSVPVASSPLASAPLDPAPSAPVSSSPSVSVSVDPAPSNRGSNLDDFADTSTEMPDYCGGDD